MVQQLAARRTVPTEVRYSTNSDHAGNSGQKRNQRAAAAAGEEV